MNKYWFLICALILLPLKIYADDSVSQTLSIEVDPNSDVEVKTGTTILTDINSTSGSLVGQLNPSFVIRTTNSTVDLTLFAYVTDSLDVNIDAFFVRSSEYYITLANTGNIDPLDKATQTAINSTQAQSPSAIDNPNALAYKTSISMDNGGTYSFNPGLQEYSLEANNGTTNLTITLNQTVRNGTFSVVDNPGDYVATIYLEITSP